MAVEGERNKAGLVFIYHGLSGFKDQPHIRNFVAAFLENDYVVVSFDASATQGESEGTIEEASTTDYIEDLEDVISWAKTQDWYKDPFILTGHSLGALAVAFYAEKHPEKVRALAPISAVVSGKLCAEVYGTKLLDDWQKTGWKIKETHSRPGELIRIPWSEFEDRMRYDLLPDIDKLRMPVLMMVGDQDESTPLAHQKILYEKLPGKKELHIIKGAPHTFREENHLREIKGIFSKWIKEIK